MTFRETVRKGILNRIRVFIIRDVDGYRFEWLDIENGDKGKHEPIFDSEEEAAKEAGIFVRWFLKEKRSVDERGDISWQSDID